MENNTHNKVMFFVQYWGQNVLRTPTQVVNVSNVWNLGHKSFYLELTPLSDITDEDAIEFFDIVWSKVGTHKDKPNDFKIEFGKEWALSPLSERYGLIPTGLFHGVDWLRSKGYALPFHDLSVDDLVNYGWVKLKQNLL